MSLTRHDRTAIVLDALTDESLSMNGQVEKIVAAWERDAEAIQSAMPTPINQLSAHERLVDSDIYADKGYC